MKGIERTESGGDDYPPAGEGPEAYGAVGSLAKAADVKRERTAGFLKGPVYVLRHHGASNAVVNSFYKQCYDVLSVLPEADFVSAAKDILLRPMAAYLGNDPPKAPSTGVLHFGGAFANWMRPRIFSFRERNTHLWYSFLQSKRSANPVSEGIVLLNLVKHRKQMQTPDPLGPLDVEPWVTGIDSLLRHLSWGLLRDGRDTWIKDPAGHMFSASQSASFERGRAKGGQAGELRLREGRGVNVPDEGELLAMREVGDHAHPGTGILDSSVFSDRGVVPDRQFLRNLLLGYWERPKNLRAQVAVVLEPLKVRTVSKGQAIEYDAAKPFQKSLHRLLKDAPGFFAIGRPIKTADLWNIRDEAIRFWDTWGVPRSELEWMSVDYSSATDGLSGRLSRAIMEALVANLRIRNPPLANLLISTLLPHEVSYPKLHVDDQSVDLRGVGRYSAHPRGGYSASLRNVAQTNGQLMGSPTSFPVLCLANLALYVGVVNRFLEELVPGPTRPQPAGPFALGHTVIINGDDMVYLGPRRLWDIHTELGKEVGLQMSPGKAYRHPRYVNINSTSYDLPIHGADEPVPTPRVGDYLNTGLRFGRQTDQERVGAAEEFDVKAPYTSVLNTLLLGAWKGKAAELLSHYLHDFRVEVSGECRGRNLFVPKSLGGLGVECPIGFRTFPNDGQRRLARALLETHGRHIVDVHPLPPGRVLDEAKDGFSDPLAEAVELPQDRMRIPGRRGKMTNWPMFLGVLDFQPWGPR